jgi:uncharacterized protein (TIRG00374 family)
MLSAALRWLRRGAIFLALLAVLDYLVLPQIAGTRRSLHLLGAIKPWWAGVAVVLEALALVSYSMLTRSVIPDHRPAYSWLIRTDLTALGVSHLLPGGAATASGLRFRLLREGGIPKEDAAVGMAVEAVGSTLVLAALLWIGLVVSIPLSGARPLYVTAAIVGAILLALAGFGIFGRSRQDVPTTGWLEGVTRRLPARIRPRIERTVREAAEQLQQLLTDKPALRTSASWAAASWLLDAASLWVFLAAYGHRVNPISLLVAYSLANLLAILPISPGGLGIIEGVLIPSLVGFGTPRAIAVLGVVSWRLFNFWAPIPAAGVCYTSMRAETWWQHRSTPGGRPVTADTGPLGAPAPHVPETMIRH